MLTTTGAGRRTAPLVPKRFALFSALLMMVMQLSFGAFAQAAPQTTASSSQVSQQPAPPLPGSPQNQMTQGQGPNSQAKENAGGEAELRVPDLSTVEFRGINGHTLLEYGLIICGLGFLFGIVVLVQLKNLPVHRAMREVSDLIYETCKTYLFTQGRFLLFLWVFIAIVIVLYFSVLAPVEGKSVAVTLPIILLFSLLGMAGSYGVAWFGIRVNTF